MLDFIITKLGDVDGVVDCESSGEARALDDVDGDVEDELSGDVGVADGEVSEGGSAAHRTIVAEALRV